MPPFSLTVTDPTGTAIAAVSVDPDDLATITEVLLLGIDIAADAGRNVDTVKHLIARLRAIS